MKPREADGEAPSKPPAVREMDEHALSRVAICVGGKVKKIFLEKAWKSRDIASMASIMRPLFVAVIQLMYALSRVKGA
jgi:hypothetical protein